MPGALEVLKHALNRLARIVNIPTVVDTRLRDMLLAVVAWPAAHARGARARVTAIRSYAVAWRVAFGTEPVGFLKLAISCLRAIEHPARAVALTTEMIAVQVSCPPLRTALPSLDVRKRLLRDARAIRELCCWDIPFSSRRLRTCSPPITKYIIGCLPCSS